MRARSRSLTALAVSAVLLGGCSADDSEPRPGGDAVASAARSPSVGPSPTSLDAADDEGSVGREGTAPEVEAEERERRSGRSRCSVWPNSGTGVTGCAWVPSGSGRRSTRRTT